MFENDTRFTGSTSPSFARNNAIRVHGYSSLSLPLYLSHFEAQIENVVADYRQGKGLCNFGGRQVQTTVLFVTRSPIVAKNCKRASWKRKLAE